MKITEKDAEELKKLHQTAQRTPVIGFSAKQMIEGRDLASLAWDKVRQFQENLGKKYGYDWKAHAVNVETCEVIPISEAISWPPGPPEGVKG